VGFVIGFLFYRKKSKQKRPITTTSSAPVSHGYGNYSSETKQEHMDISELPSVYSNTLPAPVYDTSKNRLMGVEELPLNEIHELSGGIVHNSAK
jgi:hypothetical protein